MPGVVDYQWNIVAIPWWKKFAEHAKDNGIEKIAIEEFPCQLVYNVKTLLKLREAVGPIIGMALTAAIACKTQPTFGVGGAILAALLVGAAIGAFNGFMVANMKINAFVVTLATMLGCRGLELIYCDNRAIASEAFRVWGAKMIGPFSWVTILFIVLLLLAAYTLRYSKHGSLLSAGGNHGKTVSLPPRSNSLQPEAMARVYRNTRNFCRAFRPCSSRL